MFAESTSIGEESSSFHAHIRCRAERKVGWVSLIDGLSSGTREKETLQY
jgi:hypothetical protein